MKKKESESVSLRIPEKHQKEAENLFVYLTDHQGNMVEAVSLKGGTAKLKSSADDIHGTLKLFIAPLPPKELGSRTVTESLLRKIDAWQPAIRIVDGIIDLPFIPHIPFPFPIRWCHITGALSKTFIIDGQSTTKPICNARVHICEVDPIRIWWPHVPDLVITDLREKLVDIIIRNPIPIPEPEPGPDPVPFRKKSLSNSLISETRSVVTSRFPQTLELSPEVRAGLTSPSIPVVRDTILKNIKWFHPYICLWPWFWPWFYRCDEVAVVNTDCNGRFDAGMYYSSLGDKPDIYIWVEIFDGTNWVTVYTPYIGCHTYWNYACGTDINIQITDPRVRPCDCAPIPGPIVWMKRINTGVKLRNIRQHATAAGHLANAIGLTSYSSVDPVSPFGGTFPFVVQFGSGFPNAAVTHYRWRYRRTKDAFLQNVIDTDRVLEGEVKKTYTYEVPIPLGTAFAKGSFPLGPTYDAGKPKYRIPHVDANVDVPEPTAQWDQDTDSIQVDSPSLPDGLYEFVFELLDAAGVVVPVAANTFLVDRLNADPSGPETIIADGLLENYLLKNGAGMALGFRFKMRVDNQICYADVLDATVAGNSTDPVCGIGFYNDKTSDIATPKFLAGQPNDFATYDFRVTKGNSNNVAIANSNGYVTIGNNGYVVTTVLELGVPKDHYSKDIPLSLMMGTCTIAAFAEVLKVHALHTNGGRRLHEYDATDTAAIAFAPEPPEVDS